MDKPTGWFLYFGTWTDAAGHGIIGGCLILTRADGPRAGSASSPTSPAKPSHECVRRGVECLVNMDHRGAEGADGKTGDGAGIMLQLPDRLLRDDLGELPEPGSYGVAMCFLPHDPVAARRRSRGCSRRPARAAGCGSLGWRDVPTSTPTASGTVARDCMPVIRRLAVAADRFDGDAEALERRLYVARRSAEKSAGAGPERSSPSPPARSSTRGCSAPTQLEDFFPELCDERTESALALMHSRFSTNTFPSWELAHPYRMVAHNGEVNTLTGNRNWMRAREGAMRSELLGDELAAVLPVIDVEASDSATIDSVVELLVRAGRSAPHALKLLVPEALPRPRGRLRRRTGLRRLPLAADGALGRPGGDRLLRRRRGRRDARPQRPAPRPLAADPRRLGRLRLGGGDGGDRPRRRRPPRPARTGDDPGRRRRGAASCWSTARSSGASPPATTTPPGTPNARSHFDDLPPRPRCRRPPELPLTERQLAFGYSQEDLRVLIGPLVAAGKEPTGSMGADAALAALSDRAPSLFSYFKQLFAQVTNPAIDPVREEVVMSLEVALGRHGDLLTDGPGESFCLLLERPVLGDGELARIRALDHPVLRTETLDATWPREDGAERPGGGARAALRGGGRRGRRRRHDPRRSPTAPRSPSRVADPLAAGDRGRPPPPGPGRAAAAGGDRRSRPARRARPTTSPAWSASAPRRSTPT